MFNTIHINKAPQRIISQIRKQIFEGTLLPGDKLPSESKLIEQFNVSKQTLREALRALEFIGLIEIHKGNMGGAFIAEMDSQITLELLANFLYFKKLSIHHVTEARKIVEPYAAGVAAASIQNADIERLRNIIELTRKEYNSDDYSHYTINNDLEFHCIIANSTKNPLLILIVDFIESLMSDKKTMITMNKEMLASILKAHERIFDAIVKRDSDRARTEMSSHIIEVEEFMQKAENQP
jgi:GntR family transcriptional regulator, transcriptional repressor for pyruvate dehydrogenase complex